MAGAESNGEAWEVRSERQPGHSILSLTLLLVKLDFEQRKDRI